MYLHLVVTLRSVQHEKLQRKLENQIKSNCCLYAFRNIDNFFISLFLSAFFMRLDFNLTVQIYFIIKDQKYFLEEVDRYKYFSFSKFFFELE